MGQKLYTEEQVIKAIQLSRTFAVHMKTEDIVILVADKLTPIELPSDEEIEEYCDDVRLEQYYIDGAIDGAKWMRDKILNK